MALEKARTLNPRYWPAVLALAHLHLDWGDTARAERLVNGAPMEAFAPETIRALAWLRAELAVAAGDPGGALAVYRQAVEGRVDDPNRIGEEAVLTMATGDPAAAEAAVRAGLERLGLATDEADQENVYPIYALAVALGEQGRGTDAAGLVASLHRLLDEMASENPLNAQVPMVRAWLLALTGEAEAAAGAFREAVDMGYRESRSTLELVAPQLKRLPDWEALADTMAARVAADRARYREIAAAAGSGV
jgi:hypothetical protein